MELYQVSATLTNFRVLFIQKGTQCSVNEISCTNPTAETINYVLPSLTLCTLLSTPNFTSCAAMVAIIPNPSTFGLQRQAACHIRVQFRTLDEL
jgi:hypothetical protein